MVLYDYIGDNMKKYLVPVVIALIIGVFLGRFFLEQYDAFDGIRMVSSNGESLYFIKYGEFNSREELERQTMALSSFIYSVIDDVYHVYIGITGDSRNLIKLNNFYSGLGYQTTTEVFLVTNSRFLRELANFDNILRGTDDDVVLTTISNLILEAYEELVINGS